MLQHLFGAEDFAEFIGCLLNNAGKRNDVENPPFAMGLGVFQCEGQRSDCLSASGGNRKGKQTHLLRIPRPDARLQNFAALPIQLSLRRKPAR